MTTESTTERRQRFERLIDEAERRFREDPAGYKRRLFWLGLLGYGVIFGVLFVILTAIGGTLLAATFSTAAFILLLKSKLVLPLALVGWVLLKSLWVRIGDPEGYRLQRADHPALFAEIEDLRGRLKTPPIHRVVLSEDLNAAVSQVPRLGILGPHRNTLVLGLPLLLSLPPDQARAVLAHELGHLSANHSGFNARIYRVRASWLHILEAFENAQGWSVGWLRRFFSWYAPYFSAYSFALARANEYEADAASVELTSRDAAARALVGVHVNADLAGGGYWSRLIGRADEEPEPETRPFAGLHAFFKGAGAGEEELRQCLRSHLERATDRTDTHPALKDRLAAIGQSAALPEPIPVSAAEAWLGPRLPGILADFDGTWTERNAEPWRERHRQVQESRATLAALKARPREDLGDMERWELAALTERYEPETDPLPLYLAYREVQPEDPDVDFVVGRLLLGRGEREGLDYLDRSTRRRTLALDACNLAIDYLRAQGEDQAADLWLKRGEAYLDKQEAAAAERGQVAQNDAFDPPELPDHWIERLRDQLVSLKRVREAWVLKKRVVHFPEEPVYLILFRPSLLGSSKKTIAWMVKELECPGLSFFLSEKGTKRAFRRRAKAVGVRLI